MLSAQLAPYLGGKLPRAAPRILCQGSVHGFQAAWLCAMPVFPLRSRNGTRNLLAVSLAQEAGEHPESPHLINPIPCQAGHRC